MNTVTEKIRIDRFLSSQLGITRSEAKKLIKSGGVYLNGKAVSKGETQLVPSVDMVEANGSAVEYKKHIYIMLNKPAGVVSASVSPGDVTVIDLVPPEMKRAGLFPAGRLDKDTTGFVLITDDGEFAHDILSPAKHVSKTYITVLEREVTEPEYELFAKGVRLGDILLKPAELKRLNGLEYEITVTEGRYHQIKRMFASTGNKVTALKRIKMGALELDGSLPEGKCRELTAGELALIKQSNSD